MSTQHQVGHVPVMLQESVALLVVRPGGRYVDCTVGAGGHATAILEAATPGGLLLGLDADPVALEIAAARLQPFEGSFRLVNRNFSELLTTCEELNFIPSHGVLFDLGLSSMQLSVAERGFSFQSEGPLDMRFGPAQSQTAADIVNTYSDEDLADLLWTYGEEPGSRRIARAIIEARPLSTTTQLASLVARVAGGKHRRIHPATRTFQALRIAVNDELTAISEALTQAVEVLGHGGRLVVIAYHSLEDRIVKQFIQRESRDCICPPGTPVCVCGHVAMLKAVTKGAARPGSAEVHANPRSRSARLRAAERL